MSRAVERLREFLAKHGVTVGAPGFVAVMAANAVQAAPVGLAVTTSTSTALGGTVVTACTTLTATKSLAMTTLQKTFVATLLAVAIGVGIYEARQASLLRAQIRKIQQQPPPFLGASNNAALPAPDDRIDRLEAENRELPAALALANADKARLQTEQQQARHSAALFKELADQARERNSTNQYPTARHAMAGLGRLARLSAQLKKQEESKLSPEEKSANAATGMNAAIDILNLMKAMKRLKMERLSPDASMITDRPAGPVKLKPPLKPKPGPAARISIAGYPLRIVLLYVSTT